MKKKMYVCCGCGGLAAELHEIFPGSNRMASVLYKLQVPVCRYHHQIYQASSKASAKELCEKCGIDFEAVRLALNTRHANPVDAIPVLEAAKAHMIEKLKEWEI